VDIAAGVAQDDATNPNDAAQFTITFDGTNPTVEITSTANDPTNTSPIPMTATFSDAVIGFVLGDIVVGNGTASFFVQVSGSVYKFSIAPDADGPVTVDIPSGVAQDDAGNPNDAAAQFTIGYDTTNPTVVLTTTAPDPTNTSPIPMTATFTEPVIGFGLPGDPDIVVSNGIASIFVQVSTMVYTFDVTPAADGMVMVDIPAGVLRDAATNPNDAAAQFAINYDGTSPTVVLTSAAPDPTNTSPIPMTATFSEGVTGFAIGDIAVGNGAPGNLAGGPAVYTFDVTPAADGQVTVDIPAGVAFDALANPNDAALQFTCTYDTTPPTVTNTSPIDAATDVAADTVVTATFDGPMDVSTITTGSFTLEGSSVSGTVTYDGGTNTATFTPDADLAYNHEYTAILGTAITDAAGNPLASPSPPYQWSFTTAMKVLTSIDITPLNPSIAAGRTQQFTATGTYSETSTGNLTSSVTWSSSNTTVAKINAAGLAASYVEGTTVITATSGTVSNNTTLTVGAAVLDSVIVTPENPAIALISGNPSTIQFTATACYSDGATAIVTGTAEWASDSTGVATIDANTGLATTVAAGITMITATYEGTSGNTTLTVLPDTVPPVLTLASPTTGLMLGDTTLTVSGNVDDAAATTSVIVNGGTPTALTLDGNGNFSDTVTLNIGSNTVLITAVDGSGNTGTSGTITVVVDPDKPTITITQPVAGTVTNNSSVAVTGTVSGDVVSATLILNGASQVLTVTSGSFSAN
ncbi:Ig-like domain-containing protein, partial [Chloroflexota bacterium]